MKRQWLFLFSVVLASSALAAESPDFGLRASQAFDQGQFMEARNLLSAEAERGVSNGHLFYNLGIAAYREGKIGEAMAGFLAARRYLPRDPDVAANLKFVQGKIKDRLESVLPRETQGPISVVVRLSKYFTAKEWLGFTTVLLGLWSVSVMTALFWRQAAGLLPGLWYALLIPALSAMFLMIHASFSAPWGAVTAQGSEKIKVYSGPSAQESVMFELHEGAPFAVRGPKREGYLPIEIADGKKGWLAESQVRVW